MIIVILVIALIAGYFLFVRDDPNDTTPSPNNSLSVEDPTTESP